MDVENIINMSDFTYRELLSRIKDRDLDAELEFARRVVNNSEREVNYFLGDFSIPILNYIGKYVMKEQPSFLKSGTVCYYMDILDRYYQFIAKPFGDNNVPHWSKVALYEARNEAHLYTYINNITIREFCKQRRRDVNEENSNADLLENINAASLIEYEGILDEDWIEDSDRELIAKAMNQLCERDQVTLELLVINDVPGIDAFDELSDYIKPKDKTPISQWSRKRKQDAMALLKQRAKEHLRIEYNKLKRKVRL